jgi:8-oxo-dGTP pyrophosphatase MutT (NUDIX family)|tara:strand:- start:3289 stop:3819 length:531 start_codon:yes stop_codon:yes gene_type:complete
MKKYKAIAIPVSFADEKPKFLTVRDRRFKDWIFVTGGCRRREIFNPLRCALRELEEETRGVVALKNGEYTEFKFTVKESPTVDLEYNVFVFFVDYTKPQQQTLVRKFYEEKQKTNLKKINKQPIKKTFDENDYMSFDTLEEFNTRKRWKLIVDNVLRNPEFYSCVSSLNRKTFSIK